MAERISDPAYWRERLVQAQRSNRLHHAIFKCPEDRWKRIEARHRLILGQYLKPTTSVLDIGCGWGRLLKLMPDDWYGSYVGVDLSPDFVELARTTYPDRTFVAGDLRDFCKGFAGYFDMAILISMRPMLKRNLGEETWEDMELSIRSLANKILYLEYDEYDNGSLE